MRKIAMNMLSILALALMSASGRAADTNLVIDGGGAQVEFVLVPHGEFQQGSPANEPKRSDDESQRQVTISHDFYMGKFPVTCDQFGAFVKASHYRTEAESGPSGGFGWDGTALTQAKRFTWRMPGFPQAGNFPVTIVSYADAQAFCDWFSATTRRHCALPTEAEWEYACRAGSMTAWHNGSDEIAAREIAWFKPLAGDTTHAVDSLKPNAWGIFIGGNIYEWCRDWYAPYSPESMIDPEQKDSSLSDKPRRVLRGGSWLHEVQHTRSAARFRNTPASRNADNGFRVVIYPPPPPPKLLLEEPDPTAK